jgi:integrase
MTGHIRPRGNGFELRYRVPLPTGGTRLKTETVKCGTKREAQKVLRERLTAIDKGQLISETNLTVDQWLASWLDGVRPSLAPRSYDRYFAIVQDYLVPAFRGIRLDRLAPVHIRDAYAKWAYEGRRDGKPGGLSASTRRYLHTIFRAALQDAVEMEAIARNPADVLTKKLPKRERREITVLDHEQSRILLEQAGPLFVPILLAQATGARRGEILGLRWKNIDLNRGAIAIVEALEQTKDRVRVKSPKGDKTRTVTLPADAIAELSRIKREQAEALLRLGIRQTGETRVCTRADGSTLTPWILTRAYAPLLLEAGVHPKIAQERLGHSSINMTLDLYSHVSAAMQEDAATKIDLTFRRQ